MEESWEHSIGICSNDLESHWKSHGNINSCLKFLVKKIVNPTEFHLQIPIPIVTIEFLMDTSIGNYNPSERLEYH